MASYSVSNRVEPPATTGLLLLCGLPSGLTVPNCTTFSCSSLATKLKNLDCRMRAYGRMRALTRAGAAAERGSIPMFASVPKMKSLGSSYRDVENERQWVQFHGCQAMKRSARDSTIDVFRSLGDFPQILCTLYVTL